MPKPPRKPQPHHPRARPAAGRRPAPPTGKPPAGKRPFGSSAGLRKKSGDPAGAEPQDGKPRQGKSYEGKPPEHRPQESKGSSAGPRSSSPGSRRPARPVGRPATSTDRGRPRPAGKPGRPGEKSAGPAKRSAYRPRPIQNKRPEAHGARLTADEAKDLPRQWVREIEQTSRESMGPSVAASVAAALEAFAGQDFETAAKSASRAKADAPRSPMVQEVLGLSLYHLGLWKEALTELTSYRRISGAQDQNHVIADCYRALGRPEKASEICAEVVKGDVPPEVWAETMIVAAGALADRGDLGRALRTLARAELEPSAVEPFHLRLWYVRADLLERMGRNADAVEVWRRIVAEDPDFFDADERMQASS